MPPYLPLGLWNSILPLLALVFIAIFLPPLLVPQGTTTQRPVALAILKTALFAYAFGALVFFMLYAHLNRNEIALLKDAPLTRINFYLGKSAMFAMLWLPILGVMWLRLAQRAEHRRGLQQVEEGRTTP